MKLKLMLLALLANVTFAKINNVELPATLKRCHLRDPQRDTCIRDSFQNVLPELRDNPKFFIPIEPMFDDEINIEVGNNASILGSFGKITLKDIVTHGMSLVQVRKVKSQFNDVGMSLKLDLYFPKGLFDINMLDVASKTTLKGKLVDRDGIKFMQIYAFNVDFDIGSFHTLFTGPAKFDAFNKIFNNFVNSNWRFISKDGLALTKQMWEPIIVEKFNLFFLKYPIHSLIATD